MESLLTRARDAIDRCITPAGRLQEIIYALIMVLTVTSTVSHTVPDSKEGIMTLAFAVLGCNIAWGIVDGVMFVLSNLFNRNRSLKMIMEAGGASSRDEVLSAIDGEFGTLFEWALDEKQRKRFNEEIMDHIILDHIIHLKPLEVRVTAQDLIGGVFCFVVTFLTTLPVLVPFYFFNEMDTAIRLSNAIALTLLFLVGVEYARLTNKNILKTAVAILLLGCVVVVVTILLGG